jgi:hypothetical protein
MLSSPTSKLMFGANPYGCLDWCHNVLLDDAGSVLVIIAHGSCRRRIWQNAHADVGIVLEEVSNRRNARSILSRSF